MDRKIKLLFIVLGLFALSSCEDKTSTTSIIKNEVPSPTVGTLIYMSAQGLPGWHIMSRQMTSETFRLSTGPFDVQQNFSWDKQWIVYTRGVPPHRELQIWKMKYNGEGKQQLTSVGFDCQQPAFSPDGRRIVFAATVDSAQLNRHLIIINADGSGWRQITNSSSVLGYDYLAFVSPSWFPDEERLVVEILGIRISEPLQHMIGLLELSSGIVVILDSVTKLIPWQPNLSPLGGKIVFVSGADGGGTDLFTINVDGTDLLQLTHTKFSWEPDWSPDGKQIVYSELNLEINAIAIRVMNADGTDKKILIPAHKDYGLGKPRL